MLLLSGSLVFDACGKTRDDNVNFTRSNFQNFHALEERAHKVKPMPFFKKRLSEKLESDPLSSAKHQESDGNPAQITMTVEKSDVDKMSSAGDLQKTYDLGVSESSSGKSEILFQWTILYFMPFFYGAITRLPFIYYVIHLRKTFDLSWDMVGVFVGCYQANRVITNSLAMCFSPKLVHFVGTAMAIAGNAVVFLSDETSKTPFIVGTAIIGFAETIACIQAYAKKYLSATHQEIKKAMQIQYASVLIGVTMAFYTGGAIYQEYGIKGIAVFGLTLAVCELISLVIFLYLSTKIEHAGSEKELLNETEESMDNIQLETVQEDEEQLEGVQEDEDQVLGKEDKHHNVPTVLDQFNKSGVSANYVTYIIAFTFAVESVTIGFNLAISPVYIMDQFEQDTKFIGLVFGFGALTGTLMTFVLSFSDRGKAFMKKYIPSPIDIYVAFVGIALSVFCAAVPNFPIHVIGIVLLMACNDLGSFTINTLQGTINSEEAYKKVGPLGQVVRRAINVITAVTGPRLYSIMPQLPYIIAGSVTLIWAVLIMIVLGKRTKTNQQKVLNKVVFSAGNVDVDRKMEKTLKQMSFSRLEIVSRTVKDWSRRKLFIDN